MTPKMIEAIRQDILVDELKAYPNDPYITFRAWVKDEPVKVWSIACAILRDMSDTAKIHYVQDVYRDRFERINNG
jgi:hypothetical protein